MNQKTNYDISYRPDIDGLRAVAVLFAVLYHAFPKFFPGGFIGVDIFFVISGYLISSRILKDVENNSFSVFEFWSRRVLRIYPALLLVLSCTLIYGFFTLFPPEFAPLSRYVVGGCSFVDNFVAFNEVNYFDTSALKKPLLHLWSLGIEEQFYIFLPLMIMYFDKLKLNFKKVFLIILLCSLFLNVFLAKSQNASTYYLLHTRMWELIAGIMLALVMNNHLLQKLDNKIKESLSWVLVFWLFYIFFNMQPEGSYPGYRAIIPVGISFYIILYKNCLFNRTVLSNKFMIEIGKMSYPFYLWHFPVFSFYKILSGKEETVLVQICLTALAFFLAFITFHFYEKKLALIQNKFKLTISLLFYSFFLICVGLFISYRYGMPKRFNYFDPKTSKIFKKVSEEWAYHGYPELTKAGKFKDGRVVLGEGNEAFLFIGDSHTLHFENKLEKYMYENKLEKKYKFIFIESDFPPNLKLLEKIKNENVTNLVLSYFWTLKYGSPKVNQVVRCCGSGLNGIVGSVEFPIRNSMEQDKIDNELINFVNKFRNKNVKVTFILDTPFGEEFDPHQVIDRSSFLLPRLKLIKPVDINVASERRFDINNRLINIAQLTKSKMIDPFNYFCKNNLCPIWDENYNVYFKDYDHLSIYASLNHTDFIEEIFK